MKKILKARIVHSPIEQTYKVEYKEHWWSSWSYRYSYTYHTTRDGYSWDRHYTQDQALLGAKREAETLLASTIVWTSPEKEWVH